MYFEVSFVMLTINLLFVGGVLGGILGWTFRGMQNIKEGE